MKLYTEEQIKELLSNMLVTTEQVETIIKGLISIELPSDKEIESKLNRVNPYMDDLEKAYNEAFIFCAKWMKEQILKNK